MTAVSVVGDVIEFDGYVVARISKAVPATVRGRFEDALEHAAEPDDKEEAKTAKDGDERLNTLLAKAKETAQAGMVEIGDLEQIVRELKEVCE